MSSVTLAAVLWGACLVMSAQGTAAGPAAPPAAVAGLARQGAAARLAGRGAEAAELYGRVVRLAPQWAEGWYHLGALNYAAGRFAECRDAMRRFVQLEPGLPQGHGYLGLCAFRTQEFGAALEALEKALLLGVPADEPLLRPIQLHAAMLSTKAGLFEKSMPLCRALALRFGEWPELVALAGATVLRRPIFPAEVAAEDRALIFLMGRAALTAGAGQMEAARRMLDGVVKEYDRTPGVHYGYASVLLAGAPEECAVELRKELAVNPEHLPSLVSLAVILKKNEQYDEALGLLQRALAVKPGDLRARYQRATIYLAQDQADEARTELEAVEREAPGIAEVHATLASVYYRLKRKADGDRQRLLVVQLKGSARSGQLEAPVNP
ncbi:tetratricopeptide repeat protein [Paludibaculum fermentans]|uniref:Tetratricopeptide repeat protein n=1 Tax=Paludibaculum fermentans TaxID=1473598 RepID=A0A7S7NNI4_PALFE|nr:tetratricopeptide repeat protein [Paludibaculum fermentans]QOY86883.1 tetratricopeptide repeat protein [Paludibaculum fermentans]